MQSIEDSAARIFLLEVVQFELATTVSRKFSQQHAVEILCSIQEYDVELLRQSPEEIEQTWHVFNEQQRKGTSFFDCANLVMARKLQCAIASFDAFYPKEMRF